MGSHQTTKRKKWQIAFLCFCIFLMLTQIIFNEKIKIVDARIYEWISLSKNEILTIFMKGVTYLSSSIFIITLIVLLLIFLKEKRQKIGIVLNLSGIVILNQILKRILKRPRPNSSQLIPISGYSFPSGHAMVSVAFYGFLTILLVKQISSKKTKKYIKCFSILLIFLIGISRIYLGVHYFSDVLAGFLGATCYLILFHNAYNTFKWKKNLVKFLNSFKYAFQGIASAFKTERNMKIHISVMCFVILFGVVLKISYLEWIICIFCFALVIGSEMINTAVETIVDIAMPEKNEQAKLAKDIAAGSVLVCAIAAFVIGSIIFLPKLFVIMI